MQILKISLYCPRFKFIEELITAPDCVKETANLTGMLFGDMFPNVPPLRVPVIVMFLVLLGVDMLDVVVMLFETKVPKAG